MRVPESLAGLLDQGIIEEVVRPLMSGKEAHVYLVTVGGEPCVAKIYKDSQHRSFKQRAAYTEGRLVRSSRDQRAMEKRTRYGREQDEAAWKSAEVDMIYRLRAAGVRVPKPYNFVDGVLLMELIQDEGGFPAPRLTEVDFDRDEARAMFDLLLQEVVKMLCAGVVHGDLSEYNVLLDANGPVIIDFPQSVDAASNQNAKKLLLRDVDNLTRFLVRLDHRARPAPYGQEIWAAYERNQLTPEMKLTGRRQRDTWTDTTSLLDEIEASERDEEQRRRSLGLPPRRREVTIQPSGGRGNGRGDGGRQQRPVTNQASAGRGNGRGDGGRPQRPEVTNQASAGRGNGRGDGGRPQRPEVTNQASAGRGDGRGDGRRQQRPDERRPPDGRGGAPADAHGATESAQASGAAPAGRRRRRRGKGGASSNGASTAQPSGPRDGFEARRAGEPSGVSDGYRSRESIERGNTEGRNASGPHAPRQHRDPGRPDEPSRPREAGGSRESRQANVTRGPNATGEPRQANVTRGPNATGEPRQPNATGEPRQPNAPREPNAFQQPNAARDASPDANGPAAPKRRRRRRRRSGEGARPPAGHPGTDG